MSNDLTQRGASNSLLAANVEKTVLPNGIRVLTDSVAHTHSATYAAWVGVGGRDEPAQIAGASHFLEHLLFKGTSRRKAVDIAIDIDGVGGDINAYTASEYTAFFARVPSSESELALDVLLDLVSDPALAEEDVEAEREVILEELAAAEDDPEDLVGVRLFESLFPQHPLGREVLGTTSSVEAVSRDQLVAFFDQWYQNTNLVITAAGDVDHAVVVSAVESAFADAANGESPTRVKPHEPVGAVLTETRSGELVHLAFGWRTGPVGSSDRFALALLNHVFGAGPSSRLFQEVRESRGLTYSISSGVSQFSDAGALSVQCATSPSKASQLISVVGGLIDDLCNSGITSEELSRAKRSIRGSVLLGIEDSGARGARLGISETLRRNVTPLDEHLELIDAVTQDEVLQAAQRVLGSARVLAAIGPASQRDRKGSASTECVIEGLEFLSQR
jgi:predicted Zn-dependent peptidase